MKQFGRDVWRSVICYTYFTETIIVTTELFHWLLTLLSETQIEHFWKQEVIYSNYYNIIYNIVTFLHEKYHNLVKMAINGRFLAISENNIGPIDLNWLFLSAGYHNASFDPI